MVRRDDRRSFWNVLAALDAVTDAADRRESEKRRMSPDARRASCRGPAKKQGRREDERDKDRHRDHISGEDGRPYTVHGLQAWRGGARVLTRTARNLVYS